MPFESHQQSRPDSRRVPCDRCGGATRFAAQVSPLGNQPGVRIYHCPACSRLTAVEWRGVLTEAHPHVEYMPSAGLSPAEPARARPQRHQRKDDGNGA